MAARPQPYRLQFPLDPQQVAKLDEMLQTLFEDISNNAIFPFEEDGDLLYFEDDELQRLAIGAAHTVLKSDGDLPAWGQVALDADVTGVLPIANGGTNSASTPTAGGAAYGNGAAIKVTAAGVAGQLLTSQGASAPVWATPAAYISDILTNGDPAAPELIFDSDGDVITI